MTDQSDETEILQPFSRTDILYNRNVTTLASAFEKDCAAKGAQHIEILQKEFKFLQYDVILQIQGTSNPAQNCLYLSRH